ncbi:MAG: hypothetical protein L3J29_07520 [Cyclobacteriaceae bacterium]|nr:hypothetical protein [Cyclobacteriaceae bacterium]
MYKALIFFAWNNSENFFSFNNNNIELRLEKKLSRFSISNLISIKLSIKKKLAPLIIGAVLASLALVNILLEGAELSMIGLLSIGLLILYFGVSEYWVITIEQFKESKSIWISKNKCLLFPKTLINIIDYKISKGFFPPIYTSIDRAKLEHIIADNQHIIELTEPLKYFLMPPKQDPKFLLLKIDLSKISHPLTFISDQDYMAIGKFQIDKEALLNIEI